jgi:hypothetical protein
MINLANKLDEWGFYREADKIETFVLANNFMLTKKKRNPIQELSTKIDNLSLNFNNYVENNNNAGGGDDAESNITVTKMPGELEKIQFDIN